MGENSSNLMQICGFAYIVVHDIKEEVRHGFYKFIGIKDEYYLKNPKDDFVMWGYRRAENNEPSEK